MPTKTLILGVGNMSVQVLESRANFSSWMQDVKSFAYQRRIWKLLTGDEDILDKPERPKPGTTVEERQSYGWDRKDFEAQQEKISIALNVLHVSVHTSVRPTIFHLETPLRSIDTFERTIRAKAGSKPPIPALNKKGSNTLKPGHKHLPTSSALLKKTNIKAAQLTVSGLACLR